MALPYAMLLAAAAGYLALCAWLFLRQRRLLFLPTPEPLDADRLAAAARFRLIQAASEDGLVLRHLWLAPAEPSGPALLACHGNLGNGGERAGKLLGGLPEGWGLLLVEYRGYAGNPGSPSERGLAADAAGALAWLEERGIAPERVALYGESLGSGVAVRLAEAAATAGRPVAGVVLEAPFTSIAAAAQHHYWYVPARWLVRDRFDSLGRIARVGAPLLILHGRRDAVVPYAMAERLAAAAREPKRLLGIDEGGHADLHDFPGVPGAMRRFLEHPEGLALD